MNIGVIGIGGVGGYFGGKLCRLAAAPETSVFFVARGQHLDEIRKNGLTLQTAAEGTWVCRPTLATDSIEDLPPLDVCLLCVKSYDLESAVRRLQPKIREAALVVSPLNGVDIYERIRVNLRQATVFPACVYIGTHIEAPGKVTQEGGACKILLGRDPGAAGVVPQALFDLFVKSNIQYAWFDDAAPEIWTKFIFIAAFGLVTATFDKTLGQVMEPGPLSQYVLAVMGEIAALARKKHIDLPETIVPDTFQKGRGFPYETKTSFQRDFERPGKPDERDLFGGTILRLGKQLGVETPATLELWEKLNARKPWPA